MNEKHKIIAVAGATATGKTELAARLAAALDGEVVSNDSMQLYRGMEIGTAAPDEAEKRGVAHHLLGICEPDSDFSCADYGEAARRTVNEIISRGHLPVLCGGTGLYLDAVIKPGDYAHGARSETVRSRLEEEARTLGAAALHERLAAIDAPSAEAIHQNNVRRVIRALEIYETTGKAKSEWDRESKAADTPFDATVIILDFNSRELLHRRINKRVDMMMERGLEREARALWERGLPPADKPAAQAIGYKELFAYFRGETTLESATEEIKAATRQYAKRQITWFRRYSDAIIIHPDENGSMRSADELESEALEKLADRQIRI